MIGKLGRSAIAITKQRLPSIPTEEKIALVNLFGQLAVRFAVSVALISAIPTAGDWVVASFKRLRERYRQTGILR